MTNKLNTPFFHLFYLNFKKFKKFLLSILIYNVVLVSGIQKSDSVIHVPSLFFRFFSRLGYYRMLSRIPCSI